MPHAAFCVVQYHYSITLSIIIGFQCRTRHSVWCNGISKEIWWLRFMFQCRTRHSVWCNLVAEFARWALGVVSMPHAAFCVVQCAPWLRLTPISSCFNAARGILCGAIEKHDMFLSPGKFQCRTRHSVWCNGRAAAGGSATGGFNAARGILCGAISVLLVMVSVLVVSMPHAAFCVVQYEFVNRLTQSVN